MKKTTFRLFYFLKLDKSKTYLSSILSLLGNYNTLYIILMMGVITERLDYMYLGQKLVRDMD